MAKRDISANEELTFDYGFSPELDWVKSYNEKYVHLYNNGGSKRNRKWSQIAEKGKKILLHFNKKLF